MLPAIRGDLLQFARTDVDARRRLRQPLGETFHRTDVGRLGQKLQFIEKLLGLARVLVVADDGDQHGRVRGNRPRRQAGDSIYFLPKQFYFISGFNSGFRRVGQRAANTMLQIRVSARKQDTLKKFSRNALILHAELDRQGVSDMHRLIPPFPGAPFGDSFDTRPFPSAGERPGGYSRPGL